MTMAMDEAALTADFRAAMRRQASTVCILTVGSGKDRKGMTATAVMSLSADPPTIAAAVSRSASLNAWMDEGARIAINLLGEDHAALALAFAGRVPTDRRFKTGAWGETADGAPCLSNAVATLACNIERRIEHASHSLLICRVEGVRLSEQRAPLIYLEGRFGTIRRDGLEPA